jgi:hypothetical protein
MLEKSRSLRIPNFKIMYSEVLGTSNWTIDCGSQNSTFLAFIWTGISVEINFCNGNGAWQMENKNLMCYLLHVYLLGFLVFEIRKNRLHLGCIQWRLCIFRIVWKSAKVTTHAWKNASKFYTRCDTPCMLKRYQASLQTTFVVRLRNQVSPRLGLKVSKKVFSFFFKTN